MCVILIHDTQAWWNGRHAGLRSRCSRVRVQVPPPAPRYGDSLLAISVSFCRRCFEALVPLSFASGKTIGFDCTTNHAPRAASFSQNRGSSLFRLLPFLRISGVLRLLFHLHHIPILSRNSNPNGMPQKP